MVLEKKKNKYRMSRKCKLTWGGGYHDRIIIGNYGDFLNEEKNKIYINGNNANKYFLSI